MTLYKYMRWDMKAGNVTATYFDDGEMVAEFKQTDPAALEYDEHVRHTSHFFGTTYEQMCDPIEFDNGDLMMLPPGGKLAACINAKFGDIGYPYPSGLLLSMIDLVEKIVTSKDAAEQIGGADEDMGDTECDLYFPK